MLVSEAVMLFLEHRRLRGVAVDTLVLYTHHLNVWQAWRRECGYEETISAVTISELRAFMAHLQERPAHRHNPRRPAAQAGWSRSSQGSMYRILRALWNYLDAEEELTAQQQRFFRAQRLPQPREPQGFRDIYTDEQIAALLAACREDSSARYYRDRAIILLLLESGMRVKELCSLTVERVNLTERTGRVVAKGGGERWVFWGPGAGAELGSYLVHTGHRTGALLRGDGSKNMGTAITPNLVRGLVKRTAQRAGIVLPSRAVHAFRHTFARRTLERGVDGYYLQQLLGHSSPSVTARYVRECPERLREVHREMMRGASSPTLSPSIALTGAIDHA